MKTTMYVLCHEPKKPVRPELAKPTLLGRLDSYFGNGGLVNPEMMDHDKVRDLLRDCQEYIRDH